MRGSDPLAELLRRHVDAKGASDLLESSSTVYIAPLCTLGVLLADDLVSRPVHFDIPLAAREQPADAPVISINLNGSLVFGPHMPEGLNAQMRLRIQDARDLVWHVCDDVHIPYRPDEQHYTALRVMASSQPGSSVDLQTTTARVLLANNIALPANHARRMQMRTDFATVKIHNRHFLSRSAVNALSRYYTNMIREGWIAFGDWQSSRYVAYDEPIGTMLHKALTTFVREVTGDNVTPSFSYFGGYRKQARLPAHYDREQLDYTISVLLRYAVDERDLPRSLWPLIILDASGTRHDLCQRRGAGVLFWGRGLKHGRKHLPDGHSCDAIFLGYVHDQIAGGVFFRGRPVHVVYSCFTLPQLDRCGVPRSLVKQLCELDEQGVVDFFSAPSYAIFDNKVNLALLTSRDYVQEFSAAEREVIARCVPRTEVFGEAIRSRIASDKDRYVLKPALLWGGRGVVIGQSVSQPVWLSAIENALDGPGKWVVQDLIRDVMSFQERQAGGATSICLGPTIIAGKPAAILFRQMPYDGSARVINVAQGSMIGAAVSVVCAPEHTGGEAYV